MTRVMITGASGLLGATLATMWAAAGQHEVYGLHLTQPVDLPGVIPAACDLRDMGGLMGLMGTIQPEIVIHAAAMTSVDGCETDPATAWSVNVLGTENVIRSFSTPPALFVYISTDYVFNGYRGLYTESDAPAPVNFYGRTKLAGEQTVIRSGSPWLILRTSFFGWNPGRRRSFLENALAQLSAGQPVHAWTNRYSTPLLVNDLSQIIMELAEARLTGLWHAASEERVSNWQLLRTVAETFGYDPGLVHGAAHQAVTGQAARPRDTSLSSHALRVKLGRSPGGYHEAVQRWAQLRQNGHLFASGR